MMGGSGIAIDDSSNNNGVRTVVLVGKTGNGKSSTGNTILGRKAFKSRTSSSAITTNCELQRTVLRDGQVVNVIDTPGLFNFSAGSEIVGKEIVNCINLAKDGIHAILAVFSVRSRFSQEEEAVLRSLQTLFGTKIVDYMIVVFTGGDELEDNEETLEDYLGRECPAPLKDILLLCENRVVLFDNKSKDEKKKYNQVRDLLILVNKVVSKNGGQPFTDEIFAEAKLGALKLRDQQKAVDTLEGYTKGEILELKKQMGIANQEQLKRITELVEARLKETMIMQEQKLAEEQAARLKAEENAKNAKSRSDEEIRNLRKQLQQTQEKLGKKGNCTIL